MADPFAFRQQTLESPATKHYAVSPSAAALDPKPRSLYINSDGTVTIEDDLGTSLVYNVTAGQTLVFRGEKITAATASVIAWY